MASSDRRYTKTVRNAEPATDDEIVDPDAVDAVDDETVEDVEPDGEVDDETTSSEINAEDDDAHDVSDGYHERITLHEEELAQRRQAAIAAGRRKGGALGAAMAGAMLAVQEILEKPKEEAPVVVEANSKPEDLDSDGITVELDGTNYHTPALERIEQERKTGTL